MSLHDTAAKTVQNVFDKIAKHSAKARDKLAQHTTLDLKQAAIRTNEKKFIENGTKYATGFSLFCALVFLLFFEDIFVAGTVALLAFACGFSAWLYYPKIAKRKRSAVLEKDLPFFLLSLSVQLSVNVPVDKAIKDIASKEKNLLGKEMLFAVRQVKENGASLQKALMELASTTDSFMVKRALSQVVSVFEHGGKNKAEGLKALAREQLSIQASQSREFAGKLVVYSLLFISVSTIIPAMFSAMILAGTSFLELSFTPLQVLLIVAVGFPCLDIAVLLMIQNKTPEFMR